MAITCVQAASANSTSVSIASATANDLILVFAYNNAAATAPSVAAGYTLAISDNPGGSSNGATLGYKVAAGGETDSGTWGSSTNVVCLVYRGCNTSTPVGVKGSSTGSGVTLSYGSLTFSVTDGSSWGVGCGGARSATLGMDGSTTYLPMNRTSQTIVNGLDSSGGITGLSSSSLVVTGSGDWITLTVELIAQAGTSVFSDAFPSYPDQIYAKQITSAALASSTGIQGTSVSDYYPFPYICVPALPPPFCYPKRLSYLAAPSLWIPYVPVAPKGWYESVISIPVVRR